MKIQAIKQYTSAQNSIGQTHTKSKMSSPINFRGNDSFELTDLIETSLNIDIASLPPNINLRIEHNKKYDEIFGGIDDQSFSMEYNKNQCCGRHRGNNFNLKTNNSFFSEENKGYSGILNGKTFNLKQASIEGNSLMLGSYGDKRIKLMGIDTWESSQIKGTIGKDSINLLIHYSQDKKLVEGKINDTKFTFIDDKKEIIGGAESDFELFPLILIFVNKSINPQEPLPEQGYDEGISDSRLGG